MGPELMKDMRAQAARFGTEFLTGDVGDVAAFAQEFDERRAAAGLATDDDRVAAVAELEASGTPRKEAIVQVARAAGVPRREVYDAVVRATHRKP